MKRGDGTEELEEVAALEAELIQTQTNYRKLSEHFDSYKEEMHTALCKQNDTIHSLEKERKDLDCLLGNLDSPVLKAKSRRQTEQLTGLLNNLKDCRQEIMDELERLRKFNLEVDEVEDQLAAKRKEYGGSFGIFQRRVLLQRRLMRLENQHYHVSVAFNSVLTANRDLRERITNLRCERRMFDKIYRRLAEQLDACKQQKTATLIVSNMALEQRQEAQSKIQALKERNEKEQQTFEITMRILERSMRNDAKLSEFMTVKFNERQEFKAEEAHKRDKAIRAALEADKRTLNQFKEAFECIQEVSDEKEVDSMIKSFSTKEAENFALFNYITELDGQIEALQEELGVVRKDITHLQQQEEDEMKEHEQTMAALERRFEDTNRDSRESEEQLKQVNKVLDELKEMIGSTFKDSKCPVKVIEDILGLNTDISLSNMLVYLGQIEHKAIELLNILHFISLRVMERAELDEEEKTNLESWLNRSGFSFVMSEGKTEEVVRRILRYYVFESRMSQLVSIAEGMEELGFRPIPPDFAVDVLFPSGEEITLEDLFRCLLINENPAWRSRDLQRAFLFFWKLCSELHEGKIERLHLSDLLHFFTGAPYLKSGASITCSHPDSGVIYPQARTCNLELIIPTLHKTYDDFKAAFSQALLLGSYGFGFA